MNDRDALMRHIREHPDDDAPRLVFADWLDEQGDAERAEFIRVQIALATSEPGDDRRVDWQLREADLLRSHRDTWLTQDVPEWLRTDSTWFHRGFVAGVHCGAGQFQQWAARLARETLVQFATLDRWRLNAIRELPECVSLHRLRGLRFIHEIRRDAFRSILDAPSLMDIRSLEFTANWPDDESDIESLLRQPNLRGLRRLDILRYSGVPLAELAAADPPALRDLTIRMTGRMATDDLAALLCSPVAGRLTALSLDSLFEDGVRMLGNGSLAGLRELRLRNYNESQAALCELLSGPALRSLAVFDTIGWYSSVVFALADAPLLGGLRELTLRTVFSETVAALAASPRVAGLRRLSLPSRYVDDAALRALAASPHFRELRWLDLSADRITSAGLAALDRSAGLPALRLVTFSSAPDSLARLAKAEIERGYRFTLLRG